MNFDTVDPGLRKALQKITKNYSGRNVRAHVNVAEHLKRRFRHSIRVVEVVPDARPGPGQFTCFMHALDLSSPPRLMSRIMERFDLIYPGAEFVRSLIGQGRLQETCQPEDGDIALYFDNETPRHAGKVRGEVIVSKWGLVMYGSMHRLRSPTPMARSFARSRKSSPTLLLPGSLPTQRAWQDRLSLPHSKSQTPDHALRPTPPASLARRNRRG